MSDKVSELAGEDMAREVSKVMGYRLWNLRKIIFRISEAKLVMIRSFWHLQAAAFLTRMEKSCSKEEATAINGAFREALLN